MQEINLLFFGVTKTPRSAKKIKIIINKSNFIFIPVLEIRVGRFRKSEKKKNDGLISFKHVFLYNSVVFIL